MNFTVVGGSGRSSLGSEAAFDGALVSAGIHLINLLPGMVVVPEGCVWSEELPEIDPGEYALCALARCETHKGEAIAAVGWVTCRDGKGREIGLVTTYSLQYTEKDGSSNLALRLFIDSYKGDGDAVREYIEQFLARQLKSRAQMRELTLVGEVQTRLVRVKATDDGVYASAVAALVLSK